MLWCIPVDTHQRSIDTMAKPSGCSNWKRPERECTAESGLEPWQREVRVWLGNGLFVRRFGAADFFEVVVPIACTACTRVHPMRRCERIIVRARNAVIAHVFSLTFLSNVVAYACRAHLDRIGIMLARLDNLPQRHRSVTLHAAALDVDFRIPVRCERIPGCYDPCSRNSPSYACHAKPPAIGISLAETAETPTASPMGVWRRPSLSEAEGPALSEVEGSVGVAETAETPSNADTDDVSATPSPARAG
jgi:hypothetical protein